VVTSGSEFSVAVRATDRRCAMRWVASLLRRNPAQLAGFLLGSLIMVLLNSSVPGFVGRGFDIVLSRDADRGHQLSVLVLALLAVIVARGAFDIVARLSSEVLAKRLERDAREEFYVSLLGKSQTFHNRQRIGDLMARATNDVRQLNFMVSPGLDLIIDSMLQGAIPITVIAFLDWRLLASPLLFAVAFGVTIRHFLRKLGPVSADMRERFGTLNAGLSEVVRGIEVVKASATEDGEQRRFVRNARAYRDLFVRQGLVQARYLPSLLLPVAIAGALLHGLLLYRSGDISIGNLVTYLGLMFTLGFPTGVSTFSFSLIQMGLASADRLLELMNAETELDENAGGHTGEMRGEIVFDHVTFSHGGKPVLRDLSFRAAPGETVAIVGETGAGKSTLTKLVNRTYDVDSGRILVDGVDVREWNLDALRSSISTIEQDIVLFSRSVTENIAFSVGQRADAAEVERAAVDAQADGFIRELPEGYDTVIGERGVTLSGGQRQRLAIARALLTDPAILVLDDSTSAIDSATEDEIQRAIGRVLAGRTTLLITHRLSQIRWADTVLLLRRGELVDTGSHDELLTRCPLYQRIFAHYTETAGEPAPAGAVG
jgi:ATP-binding cassette subfamily B protein